MPGRVLVLEHHHDLREALVEALEDEGYAASPHASAAAALRALEAASPEELPDVIVADAGAGRDLVEAIRRDPRCERVATVTLSFRFDPPSDADVDLRRPFRLDAFLAAVHRALGQHPPPPRLGADPR